MPRCMSSCYRLFSDKKQNGKHVMWEQFFSVKYTKNTKQARKLLTEKREFFRSDQKARVLSSLPPWRPVPSYSISSH